MIRRRVPGRRKGASGDTVDTELGHDDGHLGTGWRGRLITAWNPNALFICLKLASGCRGGLHGRHQAQRVMLAANTGFG